MISRPRAVEEARRAGYAARMRGERPGMNPYDETVDPLLCAAWDTGWGQAHQDMKRGDGA